MWGNVARRQFLLARDEEKFDPGSGGLPRFPARASLNRDFLFRPRGEEHPNADRLCQLRATSGERDDPEKAAGNHTSGKSSNPRPGYGLKLPVGHEG